MIGSLVFVGAGIGLGVTLVAYGLRPARPRLATALETLRRPPPVPVPRGERVLNALARPLYRLGLHRDNVAQDLAILDRDPTRYLTSLLGVTALGLLAPGATVAGLNLMGARIGWTVPLWLGLVLAVGGFLVTSVSLHEEAEERRLHMRHTLAALLDIVPSALAAGAGVEQAFTDAAGIASGWAAGRIRHALTVAQVTRVPLWQPLKELGETTGVVQLQQLAGTLQLASGEGSRIREALIDRGDALSERLTAEMEARAESATERMSIPLMVLTSIFLLFLVYPTMAALQP
ncbi:type II secretion system F family protein [Virgisporangium aurantiacum]|uniref:Type II secretion system protein n=1 Tax=Virgisporangium aurantiacum TaxID=175570 RepID=A0A8J3ZKB4_9ACTN|nr:type II secretion system F family protein [Virgisporangium aurantiacum]GIJ64383.1 type II secretion system protein [Virgisporangium aurantiacum]